MVLLYILHIVYICIFFGNCHFLNWSFEKQSVGKVHVVSCDISRLDCGTGPGVVKTSSQVHLNAWNHVSVFRHDWGVWVQLNGGKREEGRSQVGSTELNTGQIQGPTINWIGLRELCGFNGTCSNSFIKLNGGQVQENYIPVRFKGSKYQQF